MTSEAANSQDGEEAREKDSDQMDVTPEEGQGEAKMTIEERKAKVQQLKQRLVSTQTSLPDLILKFRRLFPPGKTGPLSSRKAQSRRSQPGMLLDLQSKDS